MKIISDFHGFSCFEEFPFLVDYFKFISSDEIFCVLAIARRQLMRERVTLWGKEMCVDWAQPEAEVDQEIMDQVRTLSHESAPDFLVFLAEVSIRIWSSLTFGVYKTPDNHGRKSQPSVRKSFCLLTFALLFSSIRFLASAARNMGNNCLLNFQTSLTEMSLEINNRFLLADIESELCRNFIEHYVSNISR